MYKYVGLLLTDSKDSNNNAFDKSVIEQIVNDQPTVPVRINFTGDPIGRTTRFFTNDPHDSLKVEFDINIPNLDQLYSYVVPGGHCDIRDFIEESDGSRRISKYTLTEISISSRPADQKLEPFNALSD